MENKKTDTAVATATAQNGNVKVLPTQTVSENKNLDTVLAKLANVKSAEKNYLHIKSRMDDLAALTFLENNNNQSLSLIDAEGNRFNTNSAKMLNSVRDMLAQEANVIKNEVERYLLGATLA